MKGKERNKMMVMMVPYNSAATQSTTAPSSVCTNRGILLTQHAIQTTLSMRSVFAVYFFSFVYNKRANRISDREYLHYTIKEQYMGRYLQLFVIRSNTRGGKNYK